MAKVKKEPENLEGARSTAENAAVALTAEERLKLASERFERADEGARARVERQIKNMEESASEAKRRESEMKKSRTAAEKQAKSVTERKLAELAYAENYRKKLLKDKERMLSAAKAKEMQKKADADAAAREAVENEIKELLENERREADERRARTDAALKKAAEAKERAMRAEEEKPSSHSEDVAMPENENADSPKAEAVEDAVAPAAEAVENSAEESAPAEQSEAAIEEISAPDALADDDMVFRLPEIKLNAPKRAAEESREVPAEGVLDAPVSQPVPDYSNYNMQGAPAFNPAAFGSFFPNTAPASQAKSASDEADGEYTKRLDELSDQLALHRGELDAIRAERERILAERSAAAEKKAIQAAKNI